MAHEIEFKDGDYSFTFVGDRSAIWHGLGQQAQPDWTREQWMKAAGHNFEVRKIDIVGRHGEHEVSYGEHQLLQRTDTGAVMSLVTEQWNPAQNTDAWDFADPFVKAGFATYNTAGTLFDGRRCFLLLKTNEGFQLPHGDDTEGYVALLISHQYGIADLCLPTSVRVVCANTLRFAMEAASGQKLDASRFVHAGRKSFDAEKAAAMIQAYRLGLGAYADKARFLASTRYTPEQQREYIRKVFDIKAMTDGDADQKMRREVSNQKIIDSMIRATVEQPGASMSEGSFWQLFHSVTWFEDHGQFADAPEKAKMIGKLSGPSADRKDKALSLALAMAKAA